MGLANVPSSFRCKGGGIRLCSKACPALLCARGSRQWERFLFLTRTSFYRCSARRGGNSRLLGGLSRRAEHQHPGNAFASSSAVFISHLWQARESAEFRRIVQRNARLGLLIMLCGSAWVLSLGSSLFDAWIGPGKFIGYPTLIVFCALLAVETHSFIIVAGSRATEDEAFAFSTLAGEFLSSVCPGF